MEQLRTKAQNTQLFALLAALNLTQSRSDFAVQYSEGRTSSTSKLTKSECDKLIKKLNSMVGDDKPKASKAVLKMRRRFFAICHELDWELQDGKLDYKRISDWLLQYSYLKKEINSYTGKQLPKLISQIDTLLKRKLEHGKQDFKVR